MCADVGRLVLAVTVMVSLSSCAQAGTSATATTPSSETAVAVASSPSVQGHEYPGTICRGVNVQPADPNRSGVRRRLDPALSPVTVERCSVRNERIPGQGEWSVMVEQRASSGTDALVTAMRQPDATAIAGQACRAFAQLDPEVWFLDAAGHAVLPAWPRDGCDHIPAPATTALDAVHWTTVAQVRVAQVTPQAALDAGCTSAWKYLFDLSAVGGESPKRGSFADLAHSTDPHLCRYRRATDDPQRGDFESGHAVTPTVWSAIRSALEATPPATACRQSAARFAVLIAGPYVEIELDGCRRVLTPDSGLRQATPGVTSLLDG
jgi:hypothetical protein